MAKQKVKPAAKTGWAVKKSGSGHAIGYYRTQKEAIKAGEAISEKDKVNVVIFESSATSEVTPPSKSAANSITPQEKAQAWRDWAESHTVRRVKPLSDEAISRESIYGDR
jgi:hypothetical protein